MILKCKTATCKDLKTTKHHERVQTVKKTILIKEKVILQETIKYCGQVPV